MPVLIFHSASVSPFFFLSILGPGESKIFIDFPMTWFTKRVFS